MIPEIDENLVAVGGGLTPRELLFAYRHGMFPWSVNPVTWWSPKPRTIIELDQFHVPKSLRRVLNKESFRVSFNEAFPRVIQACATEHPDTWIAPEMIRAYTKLHQAGHAHSVECWLESALVGGAYGLSIGGFFAAESMFHRADDASKVALFQLVQRLRERGFQLMDIQMPTPITLRLGASLIPREEYLRRLALAVDLPVSFQ